ncbi:ABC transporter substrate-binding protein [Aminobacter carboxidus]|uniref:ABC transporter substrate-binding protein n=1 Tax=Aminobacter carboxidus TaxID=376165 RepID=A0ABR9GK72_9HYPH|nr:ABC transporter substrate-binding protein [Aminobacter carboxidus]MBE1204066.1 ABC transporter substrate-binding protein [Aminobacter carboxidus]
MTSSIRSRRALVAALMSFTALAGISTAQAEETIKIGGIMSLTGAGASIGKNAEVAWKRAVDDINAAGGILGKKVELVLADTMTDPTHGVSEMRRLIESEKVQAVVGPATSQETTPLMPIGTEANIAQISSAASTQLTPQVGPYHFSTSPIGENQMIPNIAYALDMLKLTKLALISDNGGMSKAAVSDIVNYMKSKGVEPVAVQEFAFRTEDMTPQLFSLRSSEAEAVLLINSIGDDARKMLENRYDIGWDVPVLASLTMTNYAVGNAATIGNEPFEGVYSVQFEGMTYCPGDALGEKPFAKFAEKAKADIADLDRMGGPSALVPYYIQPFILAAAMNGSGKTDGKSVAAWIEANASEIKTLTGKLAASADNHFLPSVESLKVVKNPYQLREDGLVERADCAK